MPTHKLITGDELAIPVRMLVDGATFTISPTASVKARIVSKDHAKAISDTVTLSNTATGADWANSLLICEFASVDTIGITDRGLALIEVEVIDGGPTMTEFVVVNIIEGQIN